MANMDVTARFRADISDMQSKMAQLNGLYKDSAGKWRNAAGQFASNSERAAAGVGEMGKQAKKSAGSFTVLKGAIASGLGFGVAGLITNAVSSIKSFAKGSVQAAVEARKADERITAIAKSMGLLDTTLGGSITRLSDYATTLQSNTGVSDEVIKQGQAMILTFSNVARTAGDAGGMFDRATAAAVDLSAAGFGSVEGASKQLGKALQDPVKGITALGRAGVTFTQAEKDKIKTLVESGQMLKAQEIVMKGVETQVGGTAAATMTAGDKMRVAFDEFQETLGKAVLPMVEKVQTWIAERLVPAIETAMAWIKDNVGPIFVNAFNMAKAAIESVVGAFVALWPYLQPLAPLFLAAAAAVGVFVAAMQAQKAVSSIQAMITNGIKTMTIYQRALNIAVLSNPYVAVAALIIGAIAGIALAFKMIYDRSKVLRDAFAGLVNTIKTIASVIFGEIVGAFKSLFGMSDKGQKSVGGLGDIMQSIADVAGPILAKVLQGVGMYLKVLGNILRVVVKAWTVYFTAIKMVVNLIKGAVIVAFKALGGVFNWVMDRLGPIGKMFKTVAGNIGKAFGNIGGIVKSAMASAITAIEGAINLAIKGINLLIKAYNAIPFADDVAEISDFKFSGFDSGGASTGYQAGADYVKYDPAKHGTGYKPPEDTTGDTGAGADKTNKSFEKYKELTDKLKESLKTAADSFKNLRAASQQKFGEPSEIMKAFGSEGNVSSIISMYDQLDATLRDYYKSLSEAPGISKRTSKALQKEGVAQRATLKATVESTIALMRQRENLVTALKKNDTDYAAAQERINKKFDALDKAAEESIKSIEDKWNAAIPMLEKALEQATAAYDKENAVLQDLISKRDDFLGQIASGTRSFVNNFSDLGDAGNIRQTLENRLAQVKTFAANIRTLMSKGLDPTIIQDFVSQGVNGAGAAAAALANASESDIAGINAVQSGLAAEIASFQTTASAQWYDAGIAQQEAIVAPLRAAAEQARTALDLANTMRDAEVNAARAHAEKLKADRDAALAEEKQAYDDRKAAFELQMTTLEAALDTNAKTISDTYAALATTLPAQMTTTGEQAIKGLIKGIENKTPELLNKARAIGRAVKAALEEALDINSPSKVTAKIGMQVAQGLANGMEQGERVAESAASSLAAVATPYVPSMAGAGGGGSTNVYNTYEINVQSLLGDKRQIGREVAEALRAFEKSSGPVYMPASS